MNKIVADRIALRKPRIQALKSKVNTKIAQELKSEKQLAKLSSEIAFEEQKQLADLKKSGRSRAEREEDDEGDERGGEEEEENEEEEEPTVEITTILLLLLVDPPVIAGRRRGKKKAPYALTLWADGPAVTPVKNFQADKFIMNEYKKAVDRGTLDCGCTMCNGQAKLTLKLHDQHVEWHKKFRKYFALRSRKFPELKDYDPTRTWTPTSEREMLYELTELWNRVDPEAPWFRSSAYLAAQQGRAKKQAAKKAAEKAVKLLAR